MLTTTQKLTLKNWLLWAILASAALAACTLLGFSPLFAGITAGSLALNKVLPFFGNLENWALALSVFSAALLTSSIAVGGFIFIANIISRAQDKRETSIAESLSSYRHLNLIESNERWLANTVKKLSKQTGIKINHVYYHDMFANFKPSKILNLNISTDLIHQTLSTIQALKKAIGPNLSAALTFKYGNIITVRSTIFHGKKKLTRKEIIASLAHEFGHIAHYDSFKKGFHLSLYWITMVLGVCSLSPLGIGLAIAAHFTWYSLQQNKELLADAYSTQFTPAEDLISFFKKSEKFEEKDNQRLKQKSTTGFFSDWGHTHPTDKKRIQILEEIRKENKRKPGCK